MTATLCTHMHPAIPIAMTILCVRNQWQLASGNEYVYMTIIVPSQSRLLFFLCHPYMWSCSIFKIFHLLVSDLVIVGNLMACLLSYLYGYISPFNMYCLRHLFTCKQYCLQTCIYEQSLSVMETYIPTKFNEHMASYLSYGC